MNVAESRRQIYSNVSTTPKQARRENKSSNNLISLSTASSQNLTSPNPQSNPGSNINIDEDKQRLVKQFYQDFQNEEANNSSLLLNTEPIEDASFFMKSPERIEKLGHSRRATISNLSVSNLQLDNYNEANYGNTNKNSSHTTDDGNSTQLPIEKFTISITPIFNITESTIPQHLRQFEQTLNRTYTAKQPLIESHIQSQVQEIEDIYNNLKACQQDTHLLQETLVENLPLIKKNHLQFFSKISEIDENLIKLNDLEEKLNSLRGIMSQDKSRIKEMEEMVDKIENIQFNLKRSRRKRNEVLSYFLIVGVVLVGVWIAY